MATDTSKIIGAADELSAGLAKGGTAAKTLGAEIANVIKSLDERVSTLEAGTTTPPIEPPIEPPAGGGITTGNYYVATNGSDNNNGTSLNTPFKTIEKAAGVVNAGQTVLVKGGTYSPTKVFFGRHGTTSQPIMFAPYGDEKPVVDGAASSSTEGFMQLNANYTTLKGFKIQNAKNIGIACWSTVGAQMVGNIVTGCAGTGIWIGGPNAEASRDNVVKGNTVTNNCLVNKDHASGSAGWGAGIGMQTANNGLIEDNHCYENWGEGITINFNTGTKVRNNITHDNYSIAGIYADNSPQCEISGNWVYWSGNSKWGYLGGGSPDGIRLCRENQSLPLEGLKIFNNIVVATAGGISYKGYMAGGGTQNCKVYNNTLVNCGFNADADGNTRGNEFKNNIISGKGTSGSATGWACSNNCWSGATAGGFAGSGDITTAPGFVGTAGALDPNAYKLNANSPCKQKGVNVKVVVAKDYAKVDRPASGAFTIGAYE